MRRQDWSCFAGLSLCTAIAFAEDLPGMPNRYALKTKAREPATAAPALDAALVKGVASRIEACLEQERGAQASEEERKLLSDFGPSVVRDLAPALKFTSCQLDKPASPRCLQSLTGLDCAILAEPIIEAGWDRNLSPEQKTQVHAYAKALALKEAGCAGHTGETAAVIGGVRTDKLAVLIESEIVIGKCQLLPDAQQGCESRLADTACADFDALNNLGKITTLCEDLYPCTDVPLTEPDVK